MVLTNPWLFLSLHQQVKVYNCPTLNVHDRIPLNYYLNEWRPNLWLVKLYQINNILTGVMVICPHHLFSPPWPRLLPRTLQMAQGLYDRIWWGGCQQVITPAWWINDSIQAAWSHPTVVQPACLWCKTETCSCWSFSWSTKTTKKE